MSENPARDDAALGDTSRLERRARWLLRAYPPGYRADWGEEVLGTLLEVTPPGRIWPARRDLTSILAGGIWARRMAAAWSGRRWLAAAAAAAACLTLSFLMLDPGYPPEGAAVLVVPLLQIGHVASGGVCASAVGAVPISFVPAWTLRFDWAGLPEVAAFLAVAGVLVWVLRRRTRPSPPAA